MKRVLRICHWHMRGRYLRLKNLLSPTTSRYYEYALCNISCDCPRCRCPARQAGLYSFTYVSEEMNLIYYAVPKCASSSIVEVLFGNQVALSMNEPQKDPNEYLRFTFVRNPWDRMISNWKMFTTQPFRIWQLRSMTTEDLSEFADFVSFATNAKNHHWQPQTDFLPEELDFVGRVETFDTDFSQLCAIAGISVDQPRIVNATNREDYVNYYNPTLIDEVANLYVEDIDAFGYVFG